MGQLFSIGYAAFNETSLIEILQRHEVTALADVRSTPYSGHFKAFNREAFAETLKQVGIRYVFLGRELGPRSPDAAHYNADGQVQFDRLKASPLFAQGVARLNQGLERGYNIALMCAEKRPETCHRSLLVAEALLSQHGLDVQHILHNGQLEAQSALEQRLMTEQGILPDMLNGPDECREQALAAYNRRYAYTDPNRGPAP